MVKKNEVAVKGATELVVAGANVADWGDSSFSASDIVIPRLLLMQGTSKQVQDGKAHVGTIINSVTNEVVGSDSKPIYIVPFFMHKSWTVSKLVGEQFKYLRRDLWTPANDGQAWEQVEGGVPHKFEKTFDFFCILENDPTMPVLISMKSTSSRTAKELATQMYSKNKLAGLPPAAHIIKLSVDRVVKDDKKYSTYKVAVEKKTPDELMATAFSWFKTVQVGQVKAHDVQDSEESVAPTSNQKLDDADISF